MAVAWQVLLTFNDWVQAGEGNFELIDCASGRLRPAVLPSGGADDICGQAGTFDDTSVYISAPCHFARVR